MNRVYYAARDGMAITLYSILNDCTPEQCQQLLNQVCILFVNIDKYLKKNCKVNRNIVISL